MNDKKKQTVASPIEPVVMLQDYTEQGKFKVDYIFNADKKVIGISHPDWSFTIMRNQENKTETAIVCNNTDEPFGILDSDVFNVILMCWLLIDDPKLIDDAVKDELEVSLVQVVEELASVKRDFEELESISTLKNTTILIQVVVIAGLIGGMFL